MIGASEHWRLGGGVSIQSSQLFTASRVYVTHLLLVGKEGAEGVGGLGGDARMWS